MPVRELLQRVDSRELSAWQAFFAWEADAEETRALAERARANAGKVR